MGVMQAKSRMHSVSFLDLGDDELRTDSSRLQELSHRDQQTDTSPSLTKFTFNFHLAAGLFCLLGEHY